MMAESMILNMLKTPSQVREEQLAKLRAESTSQAQLLGAPVGGTTALPGLIRSFAAQQMQEQGVDLNKAARRAQGAAGGLFSALGRPEVGQAIQQGALSPEERQAQAGQSILSQVKPGDPDSMMNAAIELQKRGLTGAAQQLQQRAEAIKTQQEEKAFREREFTFRETEAQKSREMEETRFEYQQGRDAIGDERYVDETSYNRQRNLVSDERAQKSYNLEEANAQLQSKNLDLQQKRLENLIKREDRDEELTTEDRAKLNEARNNYADYLASLTDNAEAQRYADLVRNGAVSINDAEDRVFPKGSDTAAGDRAAIRAATSAGRMAEISANKALDLAGRYLQMDPQGGILGSVYGTWKGLIGSEDDVSRLKTEANELINSGIVASLPPGPASDKDIAIMSKGFPDANWNATEIAEWMQAYARIKRVEAKYQSGYAKWLSERGGDSSGYDEEFNRQMQTDEAAQAYAGTGSTGGEITFEEAQRRISNLSQNQTTGAGVNP